MAPRIKRMVSGVALAGLLAAVSSLSCAIEGGVGKPRAQKGIKVFSQPEDQVVLTNMTACFTVVAEPEDLKHLKHLKYQWAKNGKKLPGKTGPSLIITNAQEADVGFYSCEVTGPTKGAVTVRGQDCDPDVPGARLFVLTSTNTAISGPFQPGSNTKSCVGPYNGKVVPKNSSNSTWWLPPSGSTRCVIQDTSRNNYSPAYIPVVEAVDNINLQNWCGTNTVTFPVTNGHKYQFTTYLKSKVPPPNSGDTLTLDINWFP